MYKIYFVKVISDEVIDWNIISGITDRHKLQLVLMCPDKAAVTGSRVCNGRETRDRPGGKQ